MSCGGQAGGDTERPLPVLPASLEFVLRAVGVLEEFRQDNNMVLFVFFENHSGNIEGGGPSTVVPRPLPVFV